MYLLAALSLGFLGSLHCIGMCGPIALALPLRRDSLFTKLAGIFTYNSGRIITYAVTGLLSGLVGQGFTIAASQNALSVTAGVLILLILFLPKIEINLRLSGFIYRLFEKLKHKIGSLFSSRSNRSLLLIGLLNGLLPCGLVYMGITGAMATGNALKGSLFMAAFGAGTLPAMTILIFPKGFMTISVRQKIRKFIPVFLSITACLLILRGLELGIPYVSPGTDPSGAVEHCCHK